MVWSKRMVAGAAALCTCVAGAGTALAQPCAFTSTSTAFETISNVQLGTLNYATAATPAYQNNTAVPGPTLEIGTGYTITVTIRNCYETDNCTVYVDWNHNDTLNNTGEMFRLNAGGGPTGCFDLDATFTGTITAPVGALTGAARMRIAMGDTGAGTAFNPTNPCGTFTYGSVHDYTVNVTAATAGACCNAGGGNCFQSTAANCQPPTAYRGDGTTCTPSNACGGACCDAVGGCTVAANAGGCTGLYLDHAVCNPTPCVYCAAGSSACAAFDERIARFQIGTVLDNLTGDGAGPAGCYNDFTAMAPPTLYRGASYPVTLTNGTDGDYAGDQAAVWVDFSRDFVLSDTSAEMFTLQTADASQTFTGFITVPAAAPLGNTRLRVRLCYTTGLASCGTSSYGEVEDYTVTIADPPANAGSCCTGTTCSVVLQANCASGDWQASTCSSATGRCGGTCCTGAGCCTLATSAGTCGGTFGTLGSTCSPNPCLPSDNCQGAIPLTIDAPPVAGDLSCATGTAITCSGSTDDIWYSVLVTTAGNYRVLATGSGFGVAISVFPAACPVVPQSYLVCGLQPTTSLEWTATANTTYLVRVADFQGDNVNYTVQIASNQPTGICCTDATGACRVLLSGQSCGATETPGTGTVCAAGTPSSNCPALHTCCDQSTGQCTVIFGAACPVNSVITGTGNSCQGANNPCPPSQACCDGTTCTVALVSAGCGAGTGLGAGTTCTPNFGTPATRSDPIEDISIASATPGTPIVLSGGGLDDGYHQGVPLGFTFNFLGTAQTHINVSTNGVAAFGPTGFTGLPAPATGMPSANTPTNAVAPYWCDILATNVNQITYATRGTAPYQRFIVQWNAVPRYNAGAQTGSLTFQAILYEGSDVIAFRYGTLTDGTPSNAATAIGTDNAAGTFGVNIDPATVRPGNTARVILPAPVPCAPTIVYPSGACCTGPTTCAFGTYASCISAGGTYYGDNIACSNASVPCQAPQTGACCSGATCVVVADLAACSARNPASTPVGANTRFVGAGSTCNAPGNIFTPCCRGDFNQNGFKTVQDLFDFLGAWFSKTSQADVNGNPPCFGAPCQTAVTVQDLFDFLAAWFTGCGP